MRNVATCLTCGEVLVSAHRHDFKCCGCPTETRIYVDGGDEYVRRLWGAAARWADSDNGEGAIAPQCYQQPRHCTPRLFGEDLED